MNWIQNTGEILKRSVWQFGSGSNFTYAAAVAFYTMLALAPLLFVVVQLAGLFTSSDAVIQELVVQSQRLMGDESADSIRQVLTSSRLDGMGRSWMSILGLVLSLVGATTVLAQLQQALNDSWGVRPVEDASAFWTTLYKRVVSLALLGAVGFLLLVSLVADAAMAAFGAWIEQALWDQTLSAWVFNLGQRGVTLVLLTLLFALLFQVLPAVRLRTRDVWFAAAVTGILFSIGKWLIGLYIGTAAVGSAYGAAGGLAALLTWVYYASALVLFGAEVTRARALVLCHPVRPAAEHEFIEQSAFVDHKPEQSV